MGSIISPIGTIFYSLLYINSPIGFYGVKYQYSVISVIDKSLPGNTKKWTLVSSWMARVRFVHSWAVVENQKEHVRMDSRGYKGTYIRRKYDHSTNIQNQI